MSDELKRAFGLEGERALITGGGTGLGFAMAKCFVQAGADVVITGRCEDMLKEAVKQLGPKADYRVFDVTDTANAVPFVEMLTQEDLQNVLDVHLMGSFALTKAVVPGMLERKKGNILFISSMSAYLGMTQVTAYSAAKSAVLGLVKTLSGELADKGIRVNAIAPGFIDTPMFRKAVESDIPRQQKIIGHTPMGCYGDPMDIGWAAVYLTSPAARFVTGVCLPVDGGCCIGF